MYESRKYLQVSISLIERWIHDLLYNKASDWIKEKSRENTPWFAWLSLTDPV